MNPDYPSYTTAKGYFTRKTLSTTMNEPIRSGWMNLAGTAGGTWVYSAKIWSGKICLGKFTSEHTSWCKWLGINIRFPRAVDLTGLKRLKSTYPKEGQLIIRYLYSACVLSRKIWNFLPDDIPYRRTVNVPDLLHSKLQSTKLSGVHFSHITDTLSISLQKNTSKF